jgi:hypothetical protein
MSGDRRGTRESASRPSIGASVSIGRASASVRQSFTFTMVLVTGSIAAEVMHASVQRADRGHQGRLRRLEPRAHAVE